MRTSTMSRVTAALAASLVLLAGAAGSAEAAKGGNGGGGKGGGKPSSTTTTLTGPAAIQAAHDATCRVVVEYTSCASLTVKIADFGNTGWAAQSSPATGTVTYNSYYKTATQADWSHVVAHEVGGHVDTWNEIVAKVGVTQAWTDYYDVDRFAQGWATTSWGTLSTGARSFSTSDAKEAFLDCVGPVAHGYRGNYLYTWGLTTSTQQKRFCTGVDTVLSAALTSSPS
ncbi:hypothetical protein [Phycicoccus flavus]|uniref:hypothetical protein n=1 Tax=Phycicoccus flavus TaxID=2502783 RepID=UPI000FEBBAE0|nr:hypothetical protein [Phycicoccus flavus]NHA67395.1 hypothetical protein [Phycicoccus flavus]